MSLIYVGIDEAGYGPMLGPLCVGLAAFRVMDWQPGDPAPELWEHLSRAVGRTPKDAPAKIPIGDSKRLKLSNKLKTKHPLTHLERGVLTALHTANLHPDTDTTLFETLGVKLDHRPWYGAEETTLPVSGTAAAMRIDANSLADALVHANIEVLSLECRAMCESEFNDTVRETGSKAATTSRTIASLMRTAVEAWSGGEHTLRIVCDRQSGRSDYIPLLREALPETEWNLDARSTTDSRYTGRLPNGDEVGVHFAVEAEDAHMPVALASMTAKLVRELAMARFNRYWSARIPELKPTAGYVQDARRWLADAGDAISDRDRSAMIRIA